MPTDRQIALVGLLGLGAALWAMSSFVDASYLDAWWTLAAILDLKVNFDAMLGRVEFYLVVAFTLALMGGASYLLLPNSRDRAALVGLVCALVVSNPWLAITIQDRGVLAAGPAMVGLVFAVLVRSLPFTNRLWCPLVVSVIIVSTVLLVVTLFESTSSAQLSPFFPVRGELLPWRPWAGFLGLVNLALYLAALLSLCPALGWMQRHAQRTLIPLCFLLLLPMLRNSAVTSELLQIRADPKVALVYAVASEPGPQVAQWLSVENALSRGNAITTSYDTAGDRLPRHLGSFKYPESYKFALSCLYNDPAYFSGAVTPSIEMLRRYFKNYRRCAEVTDAIDGRI